MNRANRPDRPGAERLRAAPTICRALFRPRATASGHGDTRERIGNKAAGRANEGATLPRQSSGVAVSVGRTTERRNPLLRAAAPPLAVRHQEVSLARFLGQRRGWTGTAR